MNTLRRIVQKIAASRINYWLSFIADFVVMILFLAHGFGRSGAFTIVSLFAVPAGYLFAGLVEYVSHRWFFHDEESICYSSHLQHHRNPEALLALPWFTSGTITFAMWFALRAVLKAEDASLFMSAVAMNYFYYGLLHHVEHHARIGRTRIKFLQKLWAYHNIHHKIPDTNFGVTTPLWDYIFGTHYRSKRVTRSAVSR